MTAVVPATTALAQQAGAADTSAEDEPETPVGIEEVMVTARRIEESLQDTPVSVTAFTGGDLLDRDITRLDELGFTTPNLNISAGRPDGGPSAGQIFIRGVGQTDFLPPTDPGVGLSIDGVFLTRSVGANLSLIDIERVEILKGPQGALFGANSNGGAINIVTTRPTGEWGGQAVVSLGNFSRVDAQGVLYFPVIEGKISGKLVGASFNRDGFVDRVFDDVTLGNEDRELVRGQLLFTPTPSVEILVSGDATFQNQTGAPGNLPAVISAPAIDGLYNPLIAPFIVEQLRDQGIALPEGTVFDESFVPGDFETSFGLSPQTDNATIWGVSVQADWEISEKLSFKSISAYREIDAEFARDGDRSPFPILSTDDEFFQQQFTQEIQLFGTGFNKRVSWLAGAFFLQEESVDDIDVQILDGTLPVLGFEISQRSLSTVNTTSFSFFGNFDIDVTDRLRTSFGIRFTRDDKEVDQFAEGLVSKTPFVDFPDLNAEFAFFSPRFSIEYDLTEDILIYGSFGRGFKSGGFNNRPTVGAPVPEPFDEEVVNTIEAGFKSEFFNRRLIVNVAGFYSIYNDIQLSIVVPAPGADGVIGTADDLIVADSDNIGDSELFGTEIEISARPNEKWEVSASLGVLINNYTSLSPTIEAGVAAGLFNFTLDNQLIDAPEITASGSVVRYFDFERLGVISIRSDINYQTSSFNEPFNFEQIRQSDLVLLSAGIKYEADSGRWSIAFQGTNLLNDQTFVSGINGETLGQFEASFNRPREWAFTGTVNF
ncbi:MAG: TonB-dependent receptor [Pseudomonadota bacterium]